jgi:hypothetical protein
MRLITADRILMRIKKLLDPALIFSCDNLIKMQKSTLWSSDQFGKLQISINILTDAVP